jgi:dihydropteroate synthase
MILRARQHTLTFPRPALVMGVVNVTPDSFSDGGRWPDTDAAVAHGLKLAAEGAEILDVGGESTRPGAQPVSEEEELRRVLPVLSRLARESRAILSVDTMKPAVARAAVAAGASIINDVAAANDDGEMARVVAETGAGYVAMHMKGTPRTMQEAPRYMDVVAEVNAFFDATLQRLASAGVAAEQVVLDPGIGFGKTPEHNLALLAALETFTKWRRPLLLGVSRKSFIGTLLGAGPQDRLPGGLACACWAVERGTAVIRTHDVAATVQAVRMTEAVRGARGERTDT